MQLGVRLSRIIIPLLQLPAKELGQHENGSGRE